MPVRTVPSAMSNETVPVLAPTSTGAKATSTVQLRPSTERGPGAAVGDDRERCRTRQSEVRTDRTVAPVPDGFASDTTDVLRPTSTMVGG